MESTKEPNVEWRRAGYAHYREGRKEEMRYTTFKTADEGIIKWLKSVLPDMTDDIEITDHEELA